MVLQLHSVNTLDSQNGEQRYHIYEFLDTQQLSAVEEIVAVQTSQMSDRELRPDNVPSFSISRLQLEMQPNHTPT